MDFDYLAPFIVALLYIAIVHIIKYSLGKSLDIQITSRSGAKQPLRLQFSLYLRLVPWWSPTSQRASHNHLHSAFILASIGWLS